MNILNPSAFVRTALGIERISSIVAPHDTHCILCGASISQGEPCTARKDTNYDGNTFMDIPVARNREGSFLCADCLPLWRKEFLQAYSKMLVTPAGMFKIASNIDIASFLLAPPADSPFMAYISNAKQQHLIWRTPVNHSPKRFTLRLGTHLLTIRHDLLMEARECQGRLLRARAEFAASQKKKLYDIPHIFRAADRELKGSFVISDTVSSAAQALGLNSELDVVARLELGERWALSTLGRSGLSAPEPLTKVEPVLS